jgi:hypothetical protein
MTRPAIRPPHDYVGKIRLNSRGWQQYRIIDGKGQWVPYVPEKQGRAA